MKTIEFTGPLFSLRHPYQQIMMVTSPLTVLGYFIGSTVPNPQIPNKEDRPNLDEYPILCGGQYSGHYSATGHKQSRPAIVIENNNPVPVYQGGNPRYPNQGKTATHIHIHEGYSESWRGSAGCPTLDVGGGKFMEHIFDEGEKVLVIIPDPFWFAFEGR